MLLCFPTIVFVVLQSISILCQTESPKERVLKMLKTFLRGNKTLKVDFTKTNSLSDPLSILQRPLEPNPVDVELLEYLARYKQKKVPGPDKQRESSPKRVHRLYKNPYGPPLTSSTVQYENITLTWANLAEVQLKNVISPPHKKMTRKRIQNQAAHMLEHLIDRTELKDQHAMFESNTFGLKFDDNGKKMDKQLNWPTCNKFGRNAYFHPKEVLNILWEPFYMWSPDSLPITATIHKFTVPTKRVVQEYKEIFTPYLKNISIDWDQPKLLLQKDEREALLLAADRSGLFTAFWKTEMPKSNINALLPISTLRLKIENSYLAMMSCVDPQAFLMAPAGTVPLTDEDKTKESNTLGIHANGRPIARNTEIEENRLKVLKEWQNAAEEREKFLRTI